MRERGLFILAVVITSSILVGFVTLGIFLNQPIGDKPTNLHLTWAQNDTSHTISVAWQTSMSDSGDWVLYDTVERSSIPDMYAHSLRGINHSYSGSSGYIHDVSISGLMPNTTYYFICGGEKGGWSQERSFETAPLGSSNTRFAAGGDSRTNGFMRNKISQMMRTFSPDFVLFIGDMIADGDNQGLWDDFLDHINNYWIGLDGLTIPIIPALGNHEENSTKYYEQFALPNNEQWYSLNWGSDIHIAVLNSEADSTSLLAQSLWLEQDLKKHSSCLWKFVAFHRNVFRSNHEDWLPAFEYWVPLFDKYHVDIVFNGHSHNYMRTKPINWTSSNTTAQPSYSNGTMYVVTGGWGAPSHEVTGGWWVAYNETTYHFTLVDIFENGSLHLQAKDETGITFDEIRIDKTPHNGDSPMSQGYQVDTDAPSLSSLSRNRLIHVSGFAYPTYAIQKFGIFSISFKKNCYDAIQPRKTTQH